MTGLNALSTTLGGVDIMGNSAGNVEEAAAHLVSEVQSRAPVDTGHLRDSYDYDVQGRGDNATARVYSDAEYAAHVEYGTYKMGAQAHFRPAIDQNRTELIDIMARQTLEDAFGGL